MRTVVLTALCVLAGCAAAPPASEAPAASAAAPAASQAAAAEPAATAQVAGSTEAKAQFKPPPGYKAKILDWNVVYCRKTTVLGSRFPKEVCMTETELKDYLAALETMKRDKDQVSRLCTSAAGCANP